MKKFTILFCVVLLLLLPITYSLLPVFAKDASPSASPNASDQTLLQLQQEIASKAAQYKADVSKKLGNKAFIGSLTVSSPQSITITTKNGDKTVLVDQYTVFQDTTSKKTLTLKDLVKGNELVALGDVDDQGNLAAKKIIRIQSFTVKNLFALWGQIQTVQASSINISDPNNQKFVLSIDQATSFKLGDDDATLQDVKADNFLVSLGTKSSANSGYASFIYLLNPNGNLKITKTATASATPSASPKKIK